MTDRYRVVTDNVVDMRPAAPAPPVLDDEEEQPFRVVNGVVVPMRALTEPLDYLPTPLLALWTRRVRYNYAGGCFRAWGGPVAEEAPFLEDPQYLGDLDRGFLADYALGAGRVDVARDQSGAANDLTRDADGPVAATEGNVVVEDHRPVWLFSAAEAATLSRADALGLAADPALTIAWKSRGVRDADDGRALLALGTAASPELVVSLRSGGMVDGDALVLSDATLAMGGQWALPPGTLQGWHSYVLIKIAGGDYDPVYWRLLVDGEDQGVAEALGDGVLTVGAGLTRLGGCPGLQPAEAQLEGLMLWDQALDAEPQLELLLTFLGARGHVGHHGGQALGDGNAFWTLDDVYLSAS